MRANAKINHRTTAVNGSRSAIGNFGLDEIFLVLVVLRYEERQTSPKDEFETPRTTDVEHLKEFFL